MFDEAYFKKMRLINFFESQTERYFLGIPNVWGFGPHRMAEYLLYGPRRLKHYV